MANYQYMISAEDVAKDLNCSKSHAYKLVKFMNKELALQSYIIIAGHIPRVYWYYVKKKFTFNLYFFLI